MKNLRPLIMRVLNEETSWHKNAIEFHKNSPKIMKDSAGGINYNSLDDYMWYLVNYVDYPNNPDYKKIKEFILLLRKYGFLDTDVAMRMRGWLKTKKNFLDEKWGDKSIKHVGGDDSYDDWLSQIVSMGKDHYEAALNIEKNYKKYRDTPYEESFSYAIPYRIEM